MFLSHKSSTSGGVAVLFSNKFLPCFAQKQLVELNDLCDVWREMHRNTTVHMGTEQGGHNLPGTACTIKLSQ